MMTEEEKKQKKKEHKKKWRLKNKEHIRKYNKGYYAEHKGERKEYMGEYRVENKELIAKKRKEYNQTPDGRASIKVDRYNRRCLLKGLTLKVVQQVYEDNIKKYGILTCELCGKAVKFNQDSIDHKTPLSRKGTNLYENLQIAHGTCNNKKGAKIMKEWVEYKLLNREKLDG